MKNKVQNKLSVGDEFAKTLIEMSDRDKEIAFAMMQGMTVGKQLAQALADTKKPA